MSTQISLSRPIKLEVNVTPITGGSAGQILFQTTGNTVGESANLFWDNTNGRLGIGTATPAVSLDARNGFNLYTPTANHYLEATSASLTDATLNFRRAGGANGLLRFTLGNTLQLNSNNASGDCQIIAGTGGFFLTLHSNGVEAMRIPSATRNVLINTTTDAGFKLDVNGNTRVKGAGATGSTNAFTVQNSAGSDLMKIFDNGQIYIPQPAGTNLFLDRITAYSSSFISLVRFYVGTGTIDASADIQINSTTKGFLPPRMTTTQKNAIATPATGLMVYDTTLNLISVYNGTTWITL